MCVSRVIGQFANKPTCGHKSQTGELALEDSWTSERLMENVVSIIAVDVIKKNCCQRVC